jgi:hypothetical protein
MHWKGTRGRREMSNNVTKLLTDSPSESRRNAMVRPKHDESRGASHQGRRSRGGSAPKQSFFIFAATPYARLVAAHRRSKILRSLGRKEEAFQAAMAGLKICARVHDLTSSTGLILEIVRLDDEIFLRRLANEYGELVFKAAAARSENMHHLPPQTAVQALEALRSALKRVKGDSANPLVSGES